MSDDEIDVSETVFTVTENDETIWEGRDYKHAFFLRDINPQTRKVFVRATIDATIEAAATIFMAQKQADTED